MGINKVFSASIWKELGVQNINMVTKLMVEYPELQGYMLDIKEELDSTQDDYQKRQIIRKAGAWMDDNLQDWHEFQRDALRLAKSSKVNKRQYIKDQAIEDNRFMDLFSEVGSDDYQEKLIQVEEDNRILRQQKERLIGKIKRMKVQRQQMATKAAEFMELYKDYIGQDE